MADTTQTLIFSLEKDDGALPVTDQYGRLLARVSSPSSRGHFNVSDPNGHRLCLASATWSSPRAWTVTDADREPLLTVTVNLPKSRAVVHVNRGDEFVLEGDGRADGFTVHDAGGRCVVRTGSAAIAPGNVHAGDVVLVQDPQALRLGELIAVVRVWRLVTGVGSRSDTMSGAASAV